MRALAAATLLVLAAAITPGHADEALRGRIEQGGLAIGLTHPGAAVSLDGIPISVAPDGRFLVGFAEDAGPTAELVIDGVARQLTVAARSWPVQRIEGLPPKTVTPDPETLARIKDDNARIAEARRHASLTPWWEGGLVRPAEGAVSGVFGSRRILNGEPRAPHSGTDFAAPAGAPVVAAADGTVSLAAPDMVLTGRMVMIDHGDGLQTIYVHMADATVQTGDAVKRGQVIGHVGQTGRASGPHLHFGVSLFQVKLDPEVVLGVLGDVGSSP